MNDIELLLTWDKLRRLEHSLLEAYAVPATSGKWKDVLPLLHETTDTLRVEIGKRSNKLHELRQAKRTANAD